MEKAKIIEKIKELRKNAKKRNFVQTFDLIVNLKDIDMKSPEARINEDVFLPHGKGKDASIVIFSNSHKEEDVGVPVYTEAEIIQLGKNKREAKKLARKTDFFFAEPQLMPLIGRHLGVVLGPRGKMPKVIAGDVKKMIESYKKAVRIRLKNNPVIQIPVGKEDMDDEKVAENIMHALEAIEKLLPKGSQNIKNVLLKLTMSKPVELM